MINLLVEVKHPDTGETISMDIPNLTEDQIREMCSEHASDAQLNSHIERLPLNAEAKLFLSKLLRFTVNAGKFAVKIGRKAIELAIYLTSRFKKLTFWMILAAVLSTLIAIIPFIGAILSSFLAPILLFGGLAKGVYEEIKSSEPQIVEIIRDEMSPLSNLQGSVG